MPQPTVRHQDPYVPLTKEQFRERFYARFYDPAFDAVRAELEKVFEKAWDGYIVYRKSPRQQPGRPGLRRPSAKSFPSNGWQTRARIEAAEKRQKDPRLALAHPDRQRLARAASIPARARSPRRAASPRHAQQTIASLPGYEVDFLDVSTLADEPWKVIHPVQGLRVTAQPLCHWPCSCYPNHAMGQTNDWMDEIYPRWMRAHGVFILCPVHWYQAPASLKLMIDRLVCADGGNPDPTTTHGKDPALAKELELKGWDYPKHLAGARSPSSHTATPPAPRTCGACLSTG